MGLERSAGSAGRMLAWRAHAYGAPLLLERARRPALGAPGQLLVRVRAASLNPLDARMLAGYGARALNALRALAGGEGVEFPLVPGRDFVGVVERAAPGARLRRGQRVWGVVPPHRPGALAQYVLAEERWAGPAPARLPDLEAGGALYAGLSACAALRAAALRPGEGRVLLLGLGGVGQAALQLLVAAGARVLVGCAPDAAARALELGAEAALDRHAPDYERRLVDGGPYAAILDCAGLGGREAGARGWQYGRYVTLSTPLLRLTDERGLAPGAALAAAELARQGGAAFPPRVRWAYFSPRPDDIERLRRLAERGQLRVSVQQAFPWREAPSALAALADGAARGKLLLDFSQDTRDDGAADCC